MNSVKKSRLFPAFLCFEYRLSMCVVGILTRDISKALEFSQKVQAGSVWINCYDHTVCQVSLPEFKWVFEMEYTGCGSTEQYRPKG